MFFLFQGAFFQASGFSQQESFYDTNPIIAFRIPLRIYKIGKFAYASYIVLIKVNHSYR